MTVGKVFCVIPARSGSSRITHKNLRKVGGASLLERAISTGLEAFGRVFVSTDDEHYAGRALGAGATVPELRPAALASDEATTDDVVRHALNWAADEDTIVVLQPTSPFTTADDARRAASALLGNERAQSALTAIEVPSTTAFMLVAAADGLTRFAAPDLSDLRTQDVPPLCLPTGGVFARRLAQFVVRGTLIAEPIAVILVDQWRSIDIDTPEDLARAQRLAHRKSR